MDDLEQLFKKIENNILETQESKKNPSENENPNIISTKPESKMPKKSKKIIANTEVKENRISKLHLENPKDEIIEENQKENENINENESKLKINDEYADYGRVDKSGIHFQIISDINVSIEIFPDEFLTKEVKQLILKYKGVFDSTMNLWLIPYVNYEPLYSELFQIDSIRLYLHKVGSIAQEFYQNKSLQKLVIRRKREDEILDYTTDTKERNPNELPEKIRKSLYIFQSEGIKFGINHHCRFLLADEMGVGKTLQAISLAYIYRDSWPVLVVCPGSMKYNWRGEIQTWLGLKNNRICIINSSRQKISDEAYFYIISYDLMRNVIKKIRHMTFNFVILDEAHSIKNKDSLRAKNILPVAVRAKRLIIMTGTPLLAKPYEGYPLLYALRPDIFCYFKKFAYRYCDPQPTPNGINWSGTSNTKELHWVLSCLMVRRLKKDVLNQLPPKRREKIIIKVADKFIQELKETREKVKGRKGTLECYTLTSKAKIDGVREYISDIIDANEKFIVFAYHHEMLDSLEQLCKGKGIDYIRIDGTTKQETRYQYVTYFQQNSKCQVAILSIIAASTGITLTATHMVIFAELTWTPSIMIQAEDRVHRIGQKSECVNIKYLCGEGTLDDFILDKLQKKLTIVSTTLDDKQVSFDVKADPKFVDVGSKAANFVRYHQGELCDEFELCDGDDIEKKMFDDLGESTGKKDKDKKDKNKTDNKNKNKNTNNKKKKKKNKKNKTIKKYSRINIKYSDSESESDKDEEKEENEQKEKNEEKDDKENKILYPKDFVDENNEHKNSKINLGKVFNIDSTSRKKEINYPKDYKSMLRAESKIKDKSKRTASYSKIKSNMGSKISGIKDLKKYWSSLNKEKSVNKLKANNSSKNTVLTLLDDILKDSKDKNDSNLLKKEEKNKKEKNSDNEMKNKEQDHELDLFVEKLYNNQEENKNEPSNLDINTNNINSNKRRDFEQYEKDLMVNLHKINMRRSLSKESTKNSQNPEKESQNQIKKSIFNTESKPLKENFDENISPNLNDNFPLI